MISWEEQKPTDTMEIIQTAHKGITYLSDFVGEQAWSLYYTATGVPIKLHIP